MNNKAICQIDTVIPLLWRGTEGEVFTSQLIGRGIEGEVLQPVHRQTRFQLNKQNTTSGH